MSEGSKPTIEIPPKSEWPSWVDEVIAQAIEKATAPLLEKIQRQAEQIQVLKDEIAVLKGQKPRPKFAAKKHQGPKTAKPPRDPATRKREKLQRVSETVIVEAKNLPPDSRFKGYDDFWVQDLVIRSKLTRYRVERWQTAAGNVVKGELPADAKHGHFGPTLRSFVLHQYHHSQMTEPLIREGLRDWGVDISAAQLHRLIVENQESFHREKDEILRTGLRVSRHIHVDDTGARHCGRHGVCTHIGNKLFAWFQSSDSKSRINFLGLLRAGRTDYVLSDDALTYMWQQNLPKMLQDRFTARLGRRFDSWASWRAELRRMGLRDKRHLRIATEGGLLGAVLDHGIHPELAIVSDDAGQFNVLQHALCWIHAGRALTLLVGYHDEQRRDLQDARDEFWRLYRALGEYQADPNRTQRRALEARFDALCSRKTCFTTLNLVLKRMGRNRPELLLGLSRPDLPLHNNLSEGDIREYVKRRKISGGTRSDAGRLARDTFASLKKTCRKHGLSFWQFLNDRVCDLGTIPWLPTLIAERAQSM